MSKDDFLAAFAPINVVSAVSLKAAIRTVAKKEKFEDDWMNDGLEIWASVEACETIFKAAYEQNILLFDGQSVKVWAAPFEWALERKVRRIAFSDRGSKDVDMSDALALFRHFRASNDRPLDMEYFRNLNMNGFDLVPAIDQMEKIATKYRGLYKQDLFYSPAQATSHTQSSQVAPSAVSWTPTYAVNPVASGAESSHATSPTVSWTPTYASTSAASTNAWGEWTWSTQYGCYYRSRPNPAEPNGYEYEYDTTAAATSTSGKAKR